MATWSPDNYVLTLEGEKLLSKALAGISGFTVTRIVAGSGYVSPAILYKQTAVSDPKQEAIITNVITDSDGSQISVRITNKGVSETYPICQLGVYVTCNEIEGEILYMIAQCDTSTPDYLPPEVEIPVSYNYILYLQHTGTDDVTFTVSDEGFVSAKDFNDFKANTEKTINRLAEETGASTQQIDYHFVKSVPEYVPF